MLCIAKYRGFRRSVKAENRQRRFRIDATGFRGRKAPQTPTQPADGRSCRLSDRSITYPEEFAHLGVVAGIPADAPYPGL